ncbi:MAG: NAD(P)/FAD-dependent oxidoreductase, partial [Granulosicoccaceae bacterium]
SFERLEADAETDVVIIGAGYAGLNAARQLAQRHSRSVVVLDAHWPGWGASGRNGGFCCIGGGMLPHAQIIKRWGQSEAQAFADVQRSAIDHVRELLVSHSIDAEPTGRGELCLAHTKRANKGFAAEAELMSKLHGVNFEHWSREEVRERKAWVAGCRGGLYSPLGFALNPWRYVQGLTDVCARAGVEIYANSPATSLEPHADGWRVKTDRGSVTAAKLLITTNGYSSENLPDWLAGRYLPVLSSIIVTEPLSKSDLEAQKFSTDIMSYDARSLLHYFRVLKDGRFLFGARGGLAATEAEERRVRQQVGRDFQRMFPHWSEAQLSYFWSGLVCLSGHLQPYVGALPGYPNAYAAFGWHGNGVAMASYCGKLLGDQVAGVARPDSLCAPLRAIPDKMALGRRRRVLLRPAYAMAGLREHF